MTQILFWILIESWERESVDPVLDVAHTPTTQKNCGHVYT